MKPELRERRERTWEMLVVMGVDYSRVVEKIADEFDCAEGTIKADISRMENWVPELDVSYYTGVSRLRELRQQRQRLNQMAMEAQQRGDREEEKRIRAEIRQNIETDVRMSQRLGLTNEEPARVELSDRLDPDNEDLVEEFCMVEADDSTMVDLEDME